MCMEKSDWERSRDFHGHACPGLAIGYRAANMALAALAADRSADEELVAIVENDACGVDAIQVLTGCSLGKGNLIYRDYGKSVYTIACRNNGKAVRIATKNHLWPKDSAMVELRQKVSDGTASFGEREAFHRHQHDRIHYILEMPDEEFCELSHVSVELPPKASIFQSHTCAVCGEAVMEPRARVKDGKIVCIPCAEQYSRGW